MTPSLALDAPPAALAAPIASDRNLSSQTEAVTLSMIIPTLNEAGNVAELLGRFDALLEGVRWEAIVVDDDSADGTADRVIAMGRSDPRILCLRRIGRRGLSSACLEGVAAASGRYCAIMDADLQHDERLLPDMLRALSAGDTDLVVGSRYVEGGGVESWSAPRRALSRSATILTRLLLRVSLADPMSGFFMIRTESVRRISPRLSGAGFKLLLDLVASSPEPLRIRELPYCFAPRTWGRSKLDAGELAAFASLLAHHLVSRARSRFASFCLVGGSGVLVHLAVFLLLQGSLRASFALAQTSAVIVSIVSNYTLNNRLTFGDRRLRGGRYFGGLSRFAALCALGAIVNLVVAQAVLACGAANVPAALAGIAAGALCNYLNASTWVWRRP